MIASHARSQGLILVSNNSREVKRIPGLRRENWINGYLRITAAKEKPAQPAPALLVWWKQKGA